MVGLESGVGEPVLYHKDLLVGVVGGELCLFIPKVAINKYYYASILTVDIRFYYWGYRWAVLPLSTLG